MSYGFELLSGLPGLEELEAEWNEISAAAANPAFYNDWRWHHAIAKHLIGDGLHYLKVNEGSTTVAIVPLQVARRSLHGLQVVTLGVPAHSHLNLADVVVREGHVSPRLLDAARAFLRREARFKWLVGRFTQVSEGSSLEAMCRGQGFEFSELGGYYKLDPRPGEQLIERVSGKVLRNTARLERKCVKEAGETEFSVARELSGCEEAVERFMKVEASGWKGEDGTATAIRLDPGLVGFYHELARSYGATRQAWVAILSIAGEPAAAQFGIVANDTLNLMKIAYDERFSRYSPGSMLLKAALEQPGGGFNGVNLMTAPGWADRWHLDRKCKFAIRFSSGSVAARGLEAATLLGRRLRELRRPADKQVARP